MTKQQMCDVLNYLNGYRMTPDVWTKEELTNYLEAFSTWKTKQVLDELQNQNSTTQEVNQ